MIRLSTLVFLSVIPLYLSFTKEMDKVEVKYSETRDEINKTYEQTRDSIKLEYATQCQLYLDRPVFTGTPLTGEMMAESALNAYDSTGVLVPYELALSQAQWESGMGRRGRSPATNPYNVGEWSEKTVTRFKTTRQGVQSYYYLIARDYLTCKELEDLLENFVNCNGHRYASATDYEHKIKSQVETIKKWLKNI